MIVLGLEAYCTERCRLAKVERRRGNLPSVLRRRSAIKPRSAKATKAAEGHAAIRERVFDRDRCCVAKQRGTPEPCMGPLTPHHVLKASAGGEYTEENLLALCAHHNTWVEDHPKEAEQLGLVRRKIFKDNDPWPTPAIIEGVPEDRNAQVDPAD